MAEKPHDKDVRRLLRRRYVLGAAGVGVTAAIAGCGSSDDSTSDEEDDDEEADIEAEPDDNEVDVHETALRVGAQYALRFDGEDGILGVPDIGAWTNGTPGTPVLGAYDSADPDVVDQHLEWMLEHGIDWINISTGFADQQLDILRDVVLKSPLVDAFDISILTGLGGRYEHEPGRGYDFDLQTNRDQLVEDFATFGEIANLENYLHFDDRPVLYLYTALVAGDVKGAVEEAREATGVNPYLIGDLNMGNSPALPRGGGQITAAGPAFDALTAFSMFPPLDSEAFPGILRARYRAWRLAAYHYDCAFIPGFEPGFDASAKDWSEATGETPRGKVLERDPDRFAETCSIAAEFAGSTPDAVLVSTFNEWPEHTNIEPSEEEGNAYLETVADVFEESPVDRFEINEWTPVTLEFDRTGKPGGGDDRELAFQLEEIEALSDEESLVTYAAGEEGPNAGVVFIEGAFRSHAGPDGAIRSLGGPTSRTTFYLQAATSKVTALRLVGSPAVVDDNTATVYVADERFGQVELGQTGGSGVEYVVD